MELLKRYRFSFLAIVIVLLCALFIGCGFKLRSKSALPPQLRSIYFSSDKPYSPLSIQLRAMFKSMHVQLTKRKMDAPFTLLISKEKFSYHRSEVVNASLPTLVNYNQEATLTIVNNRRKHPVISREFSVSKSVTLNANQIYTATANDFTEQSLSRKLIPLIYYWLISTDTKTLINHATITHTIKHTS